MNGLQRESRQRLALILPWIVTGTVVGGGLAAVGFVAGGLPERIATHWDATGDPNAWSGLGGAIAFAVILTVALTGLLWMIGRAVKQTQTMAAIATGMAVFLGTVMFGSIVIQANSAAVDVGPLILVGMAVGAAIGVATWFAVRTPTPPVDPEATLPRDAEVLSDVPDGARLAWSHRVRASAPVKAFAVIATGAIVVGAVTLAFAQAWWLAAVLVAVALPLAFLLSTFGSEVLINAQGLRVHALITWVDLPLATISGASTKPQVHPMGDFGGWGIRGSLDGTRGYVTAPGEALVVHRGQEPDWVITVDDAATAARTLNTLVQRRP